LTTCSSVRSRQAEEHAAFLRKLGYRGLVVEELVETEVFGDCRLAHVN
jgi:hypothetical protein